MYSKTARFNKKYGVYSHAASGLIETKKIAKNNIPFDEQKGDRSQAKLEKDTIKSIDAALTRLKPMKMGFKRP